MLFFIQLYAIPYTLFPVSASHCNGLDLNDPDQEQECIDRSGDLYCDGNNIFENLDNGEHQLYQRCSIGQTCVALQLDANDPNSPGQKDVTCQNPGTSASPASLGQRCEYFQRQPDGDYVCQGLWNLAPSGNLTCQYHPTVDSRCTKASASRTIDGVFGKVQAPDFISRIGFGAGGISKFLTNVIRLIYIIAGIAFLFMIIISAFQWITSGGDKDAISKARGRLTNAVIGITLLAVAGFLITLLGQILGFRFFS